MNRRNSHPKGYVNVFVNVVCACLFVYTCVVCMHLYVCVVYICVVFVNVVSQDVKFIISSYWREKNPFVV